MASLFWAKLYIEIIDDWKMGSMPDNLWRRTIECILLAKEKNEEGLVPDIRNMAYRLHVDLEILEAELDELSKIGIMQMTPEGWHVINYVKWQAAMTDAERQKRHRERAAKQEYHESVTLVSQPSHETVTNRDTEENRKEKKRKEKTLDASQRKIPPLPPHLMTPELMNAWGEWRQHRLEEGKPITWSTATKQYEQFRQWGIPRAIAAMDHSIKQGYTGLVEPKSLANGQEAEPAGFSAGRKIQEELRHGNT